MSDNAAGERRKGNGRIAEFASPRSHGISGRRGRRGTLSEQASKTAGYPLKVLQVVALALFALKLALLAIANPFMDEAYYWMWGQHPALSYFDHPPMVAWVQGLSAAIFGWNRFALRLPIVLTMIGDFALLYLFARRLAGERWRDWFWLSAVIFLTAPIYLAMTTVTLPDHLLILFGLASLCCLHGFAESFEAGTPRWRWLYLGAVALGLTMLTKYYGALLGAGFVLFVVLRARGMLRSPHFYLAALLAIAMQAPVIVWNIQNDFASLAFIVGGRSTVTSSLSFIGTLGYLLGIVAIVSPFLMWPMVRFALGRGANPQWLPITIFWVSTLAFFVASLVTNILIHWNLVAYIAMLPFLVPYLRSRILLAAQVAYGVLAIGLLGFNYGVAPIVGLIGYADQTSAWSHGWDEIAPRVAALKSENGAAFVATNGYVLAGSLGFAMRDPGVTSLSSSQDAFDFWRDDAALDGKDAIIVGDKWRSVTDGFERNFESVTLLETIRIERFGKRIDTYRIYLGKGFSAASQAEKSTAGSGRAM